MSQQKHPLLAHFFLRFELFQFGNLQFQLVNLVPDRLSFLMQSIKVIFTI